MAYTMFTYQAPVGKKPSMVTCTPLAATQSRWRMPTEPMQAMQQQAIVPNTQAINTQKPCLLGFLFFLRTGMKKDWIEKACPMAAAMLMQPVPKGMYSQLLQPWSQVTTTQIRKSTQAIMLTIPKAMRVAPKSKYLSTNTRMKSSTAFTIGLTIVYSQGGTRPSHWTTMRDRQRISMSTRLSHTMMSQMILMTLLPLKCLSMDTSRSEQYQQCSTQRKQEYQLRKPVIAMTIRVKMQPALSAMMGSTRMSPPIMPLTMATTVMGALRPYYPAILFMSDNKQGNH